MKKIKNIVVCLDLSEQDDALLDFACYFSKWLPSLEQIILAHNIKYNLPEEVREQLAGQETQLTTLIADDLTEKAETIGEGRLKDISFRAIVTEEVATDLALNKICRSENVGLVLVGKKPLTKGTGIIPDKLLRSLPCSLLLVPNTAYHRITNILVPIDFSKSSRLALETSLSLQKLSNALVTCLHVYKIPERYFPYIAVDKIDEQQEKEVQSKLKKFLEKFEALPPNLQTRIGSHQGGSISKKIYYQAIKEKADLVVMGAKGENPLHQMAAGTVTESLSNMDLHFPLMVVK